MIRINWADAVELSSAAARTQGGQTHDTHDIHDLLLVGKRMRRR